MEKPFVFGVATSGDNFTDREKETQRLLLNFAHGVYDCVGTAIQKRVLQASDSMKYCNAGVLLIDLKKRNASAM